MAPVAYRSCDGLLKELRDATEPARPIVPGVRNRTTITQVGLAGTARVVGTLTTEGGYVDARRTGSTAHVVVTSAPRIGFPAPPRDSDGAREATERDRRIVRAAPLDAWLPGSRSASETPRRRPTGRPARP